MCASEYTYLYVDTIVTKRWGHQACGDEVTNIWEPPNMASAICALALMIEQKAP